MVYVLYNGNLVEIVSTRFFMHSPMQRKYAAKTDFIREWWDCGTDVMLITRPRRFGKTLNMSMLECFFSCWYAGRGDLFEGLSIWDEETYRQLQGTYPVIFLSFANIKAMEFLSRVRSGADGGAGWKV